MKKDRNQQNLDHIANKDFDALLRTNQRYINQVAYSFGIEDQEILKDLMQCGRVGLWMAYERYDPEKCPIFIGFASWYIRKEMLAFLSTSINTIRMTGKIRQMIKEGTLAPIQLVSTAIVIDDYGTTVEERLPTPDEESPTDLSPLKTILNELKEPDRILIEQYYGIGRDVGMTFKELSEVYGTTKQNIQQKVQRIIKNCKQKTT